MQKEGQFYAFETTLEESRGLLDLFLDGCRLSSSKGLHGKQKVFLHHPDPRLPDEVLSLHLGYPARIMAKPPTTTY